MGAALGICPAAERVSHRIVNLGDGSYVVSSGRLREIHFIGAGRSRTRLQINSPPIEDLRLSDLTVTSPLFLQAGSNALDGVTALQQVTCLPGCVAEIRDSLLRSSLTLESGSAAILDHSTITRSQSWGLVLRPEARVEVRSSIIWRNKEGGIYDESGLISVHYSCIQDGWDGEGNLSEDPRFCGWREPLEVAVRNDQELVSALWGVEYDLGLRSDSPCRGKGLDGSNMGADLGVCEGPPWPTQRTVRVAAGNYGIGFQADLEDGVRIIGASRDNTVLSISSPSLSQGGSFEDLTLRTDSGLRVLAGAAADLRRVAILGSRDHGIYCDSGSSLRLVECVIAGNQRVGVAFYGADLVLDRCTVARNGESGMHIGQQITSLVTSSILWGNKGGAFLWGPSDVSFSCIQGGWPGEGNIDPDPLFCGWPELHADPGSPEGGDGSPERPFQSIGQALGAGKYRLSLQENSPCIGAGEKGKTMGAEPETCEPVEPNPRLVVRLAPGDYQVSDYRLQEVDIAGAGRESASLTGSVWLEGDASLSGLTLVGNLNVQRASNKLAGVTVTGGIFCHPQSAIEVVNVLLQGNRENTALTLYQNATATLERCTVAGSTDFGLRLDQGAKATVTNSIIWRNGGGIFLSDDPGGTGRATAQVRYSCIQGAAPWPGKGNLNTDPRFCGWKGPVELSAGSQGEIEAILDAADYDYALASDSPCLASGQGGSPMGADLGLCQSPSGVRLVRLAPGRYSLGTRSIGEGIRLAGASHGETVLEGYSLTLFHQSALEDLTVEMVSGTKVVDGAPVELRRVALKKSFGQGLLAARGSRVRLSDCAIAQNGGPGVIGSASSAISIERSTVAGNSGPGLRLEEGATASATSSIIWGNLGGAVSLAAGASLEASYSSIEAEEPWPGSGNIHLDPQLCGWTTAVVEISSLDALTALDDKFRVGLAPTSPCIGTGLGGGDMGAPWGGCEAPGAPRRTILLGPGSYPASRPVTFPPGSIEFRGAGQDRTVLKGTVASAGAACSSLTIEGSLAVQPGSSPVFTDCTIRENGDRNRYGVQCAPRSRPTFRSSRIVNHLFGSIDIGEGAAPSFKDCLIAGNGGGIRALDGSWVRFDRCVISGNGSPIRCLSTEALFQDCFIVGNYGGIECQPGQSFGQGSLQLEGCLVASNMGQPISSTPYYAEAPGVFLERCTIADETGSQGFGILAQGGLSIRNSIIWINGPISLQGGGPKWAFEFSCIGVSSHPGRGVINRDPRFCLWDGSANVYVDPRSSGPGQGTSEDPYSSLEIALAWTGYYSLAPGSPCLTAGEGKTPIGAPLGTCATRGFPNRTVHLAPGRYATFGLSLLRNVSLQGAGTDKAIIEGSLLGLKTGSFVSDLTITKGTYGGILIAGAAPRIIRTRIAGTFGKEGAVVCWGGSSPVLDSCEIVGNLNVGGAPTGNYWGALHLSGSRAALTNCLVAGNTGSGISGDWQNPSLTRVTLTNCTVAQAPADSLWGIDCSLRNCIVTGGFATDGWAAIPISATNSLFFQRNNGAPPGPGNLASDPLFVESNGHWEDSGTPNDPLDDVFVPGDYRLQIGSPAINAGTASGAPATDLDGNARPCFGAIDMGAYEYCGAVPPPPRFLRGDSTGDGAINITDPIHIIFVLFAGAAPPLCLKRGDADDNSAVDVTDAIRLLDYLFRNGAEPPQPFPGCGIDPTDDDLPCEAGAPCN